jgi:hypothetical protein
MPGALSIAKKTLWSEPSSHPTLRWRGASRANPSLEPNSLLAGKIQGISFISRSARINGEQKEELN